jgi:long-chain acyl-CoA synthetase
MPESAILNAVLETAARFPKRTAIVAGEPRLSYEELERRIAATAAEISGKTHGDIVGLLQTNTPEFATAFLGAQWVGKAVAILPTLAPPTLLQMMAAEAGLETVITSAELAPRLAGCGFATHVLDAEPTAGGPAIGELPGAAAVLLYTSGTTGRPKAVALSDRNILANIEGARQAVHFSDSEVMLAILPLFHAYGLTVTLLLPLVLGGTVVLQERFVPRAALTAIERNRATALVAVPSQYRLLVKEQMQAETSSLRFCIAGAERLSEQVARGFEERFGAPILQGYGATEASPVIAINPPNANRLGSVGPPLPNLKVTLREDGEISNDGGEVWVEGPSVMLGYHNRPQETAEKIVNGALRTGDRGFLDADGFLHLAGRADDLVKVAGEKVYPAEVEAAMEAIAGVEEVAVVATPDEARGSALTAFVQPKPGVALDEPALRAGCRERLEGIKVPRVFVIVEQLPRTVTGKVDRKALAASQAAKA